MRRIRLNTLMLLVIIAALAMALFVQGRRVAELEAIAGPILKARSEVSEKRSAGIQIKRQAKFANAPKGGEAKGR